ncbi:Crp/Fnr family transcriptional regulator [Synechococcus sp. Tobar12-5m-g]|nr:Crp/Fnr family transcriptional regulator [Synechococcus sp. Tobar12-5m-g]MCP9873671.1 Crp/Fnr family transcriptional regulator [Synechococcus sp. Cruz CV-v-12]
MVTQSPTKASDLAEISLFALLSEQQRHRLLDQHRGVTFAADQLLILDHDESQGLILLRNGIAKVRRFTNDGEEAVLSLLGPGEVCGEMAVLNNGRRSADVVSLTQCEAVFLRVGPFRELLNCEPRLALALAKLEARRLQDLNRRFTLRGADASTRLLATLCDIAVRAHPGADTFAATPPLPHRELAALSGLARETTSRTLSKLRQRGIVVEVHGGGLKIVDRESLRQRDLL